MATREPKGKLDAPAAAGVNGPEGEALAWRSIDWQRVEGDVRRLRQRIFTRGLLEPCAGTTCTHGLRGPGRSNAAGLPATGFHHDHEAVRTA
jgi:hypothetical protein